MPLGAVTGGDWGLERKCDSLEAVSLESCTTDKTTVDVRTSEKLLSVCRVARTTVKDRDLLSKCTELLSEHLADLSMDLLCLLSSRSKTCTDSPNWLVSYYYLCHLLSCKLEKNVLNLRGNNLEVTTCLTLLLLLADAEDR